MDASISASSCAIGHRDVADLKIVEVPSERLAVTLWADLLEILYHNLLGFTCCKPVNSPDKCYAARSITVK
jgi:hypothetical protein